jgi:flavodoxin
MADISFRQIALDEGGTNMKGKTLIAYFSRTGNNYVDGNIIDLPVGNTEVAAKRIEELMGGDLFKIESVRVYSGDYSTCTKEAEKDLRAGARPELLSYPENFQDYDTIILGYPNWWGTMPMPVYTFLEKYNFSGKTIWPFCTNEGSGMGTSESDIRKIVPGAEVKKGLSIHGGSVKNAREEIAAWINNSK